MDSWDHCHFTGAIGTDDRWPLSGAWASHFGNRPWRRDNHHSRWNWVAWVRPGHHDYSISRHEKRQQREWFVRVSRGGAGGGHGLQKCSVHRECHVRHWADHWSERQWRYCYFDWYSRTSPASGQGPTSPLRLLCKKAGQVPP